MAHPNFTTIESIGREQLIRKIGARDRTRNQQVTFGIGDDAAVIQVSDFKSVVQTSETFVEGVDFDLVISPLRHLGYKIVSATISDIYAMNATPIGINVNLALSNKFSVEMIEELYEGIDKACAEHGIENTGGDVSATQGPMIISTAAIGEALNEQLVYRSGAKMGDAICVSGDLGGAVAGLNILLREKQHFEDMKGESMQPDLDDYEYVVRRQLVPFARKDIVDFLHENEYVPSSMIDVSQGLAHELLAIHRQSNVGLELYGAAFPIVPDTRRVADEMETDVDRYALYGGEDYELMFTYPKDLVEELLDKQKDITIIGRVTDQENGVTIQMPEGTTFQLDEQQ